MSVLRVTGKISHTALSAQKWISDAGADDRKVPNNSRVDDGVGPKRRVYSASSAGQLEGPSSSAAISAHHRLHLEFRELNDHITHAVADLQLTAQT